MGDNDSRPRRETRSQGGGQDRNRRMFAGIQSHLGGSGGSPLNTSTREKREKKQDEAPVEELADLDAIISQISDMSIRPDRSAAQIKRNIASSSVLGSLSSEEWEKLSDSLLSTALEQGENEFAVAMFLPLMDHPAFCDSISARLMAISSSSIMDEQPSESIAVPSLLGSILCAQWPRHMSKAIDTVNPILFTAVSIVKGWILVVSEDNEICEMTEEDLAELEEDERPTREDPVVVNRCAQAVTSLCEATQRSLWMKWPDVCDEIYAAIKPAITHNTVITGSVKSGLLHVLLLLHSWTKGKAPTNRSVQTQTVATDS